MQTPATAINPPAAKDVLCLHAAWATDAAYVHTTKMSIFSASQRTPATAVFVVLMPPDDYANTDWEDLRTALRPTHTLRVLPVADPRIDACVITSDYISRTSYLRFLLPDVLPDVAWCLYLDGDTLVLDDLSLLWREIDPALPISAVRDFYLAAEHTNMQALGLPSYFNSGIIGLNLQEWRTRKYTEACFRLAASDGHRLQYQDQDILNLIFAGQVGWIDPRWNIQSGITRIFAHDAVMVSKEEWRRMLAHPGIAHFTGPRKPLHFWMRHGWAWSYWKLAMRSPWRAQYEPQQVKARRRYLGRRWKYWRRWLFWLLRRRKQSDRFFVLFE